METQEIKRIVDKQIEVGLELVTDGEFRRTWWHSTLEFGKNPITFSGSNPILRMLCGTIVGIRAISFLISWSLSPP